MTASTFSFIVRGHMSEEVVDAIHEAVPDAFVSVDRDFAGGFIEFDREVSGSPLDDMLATMDAIENIEGIRVERMEPDELVSVTEIAEKLGRSRQSIDHWVRGIRGPGGFPVACTHSRRNPLWRWGDVIDWVENTAGEVVEDPFVESRRVAALINAMLDIRRNREMLTRAHEQKLWRVAQLSGPVPKRHRAPSDS